MSSKAQAAMVIWTIALLVLLLNDHTVWGIIVAMGGMAGAVIYAIFQNPL